MFRDRYLLQNILRAQDEGGGGGAGTADVDDDLDQSGEGAENADRQGLDDGGAPDGDNADDGADEGKPAAAAPKPLTDEEFQAELAKRGLTVAPVAKVTDATQVNEPADPLKSTPNFRIDARRAVLNHPEAEANGWINEQGEMTEAGIDRAEDYALKLAADWRAEEDSKRYEAQNRQILERQKPAYVASHAEMFKAEGEAPEVATTLAADMVDALMMHGPKAFAESEEAEVLRSSAYIYAQGLARIREQRAAREGGNAPPTKKAQIDGPPPETGVSKESAAFEKDFIAAQAGSIVAGSPVTVGKPLTQKQREYLKAEFPALYE